MSARARRVGTLPTMTDACPLLIQSNSPLVITCDGCGRDVQPRFESTLAGFRQAAYLCECGFLNVDPRIVDDNKPAETVAGDSVGEAA